MNILVVIGALVFLLILSWWSRRKTRRLRAKLDDILAQTAEVKGRIHQRRVDDYKLSMYEPYKDKKK